MTPPLVDIAADVREAERVEAVARAIWEAQQDPEDAYPLAWEHVSVAYCEDYRRLARAAISADPGPDTDVVSEANRLVDAITDEQAADVAAALSSPGPDTADQLRQRVHDLADEFRTKAGDFAGTVLTGSNAYLDAEARLRAVAGPSRDEEPAA